MNRYFIMLNRELWEHTSLFKLPAMFYLLVVLGNIAFGDLLRVLEATPTALQLRIIHGAFGTVNSIAFILFIFLAAFYLLDCLYTERKDRSILYWRSLPVSDTETVLLKLLTAIVVIPLILWLTLISAHLTILILQSVLATEQTGDFLSLISLGKYWLNLALVLMVTMLWSLPLLTWLMFCSAWTNRTPLITVITIPIVLAMIELLLPFELNLGGHMLSRLPFGFGNQGSGIDQFLGLSALGSASTDDLLYNITEALSQADLLIGIVISALLVTLTIQVRRWRDVV